VTIAPAPTPLAARIDAELAGFVDRQRLRWGDEELEPLLTALRRFVLTGGKRLRPALCYWAWRGLIPPDEPAEDRAVVIAGAALEMFHCFALIHDDIIDASGLRRGRPSVHEQFAAAHRRHGWRGAPNAFGHNAALLSGDLCAVWADELLAECPAETGRLGRARRLFVTMRGDAVAGEYLEIAGQATADFGPRALRRAARVIELKTARYSVILPLQIGAVLAGATDAVLEALAAFGRPLGAAFQLRDDVLGVFGDPAVSGKSALDDLRQAKPTTLLAEAYARADAGGQAVLAEYVGDPHLEEAGAALVREAITACGALAAVESRIRLAHAQARQALDRTGLTPEARQRLQATADFVATRSA
jgi:geranylgeranyl diphosphate synthase, type I